jgi:hypothetical protein
MKVRYGWDAHSDLPAIQLIPEDSSDRMVLSALDEAELLLKVTEGEIPTEPLGARHEKHTMNGPICCWLKPINREDPVERNDT